MGGEQEVKRDYEKIAKEVATQEKREVQLQEKRKHATSQHKKLTKAITDVRSSFFQRLALPLIDG